MGTYNHSCHFCGRSEAIEAKNRTVLPKGWRWVTIRRKNKNAEPVCHECWIDRILDITSGRGSSDVIPDGKVRRCCR